MVTKCTMTFFASIPSQIHNKKSLHFEKIWSSIVTYISVLIYAISRVIPNIFFVDTVKFSELDYFADGRVRGSIRATILILIGKRTNCVCHIFFNTGPRNTYVTYSKSKVSIKSICYEKAWIGPIRTEISPYKIRLKMFIFQIVRFDGICIWQNYFCILSNLGDFGAKTSLFRYLINQKRKTLFPPPRCINKPPISEMCVYIRHNLYKWGLDTRGGTMF